jgi:hypothetical protein
MEKIVLGTEVMVSDPCYEVPTWCQIKVKNVLSGKYVPNAVKLDCDDWGNRVAYLTAIHEDYINEDLKWRRQPGEVGVDSGQAGIFSMDSYRNDEIVDNIGVGDGDISFFNEFPWSEMGGAKESGEKWYQAMCSRTLGEKSWGFYTDGVVSSSGLGDGSYDLYVARVDRKIVGFCIDFRVDPEQTFPPGKKKNKLHPLL